MINLLLISNTEYMDWMSAIIAILALLIMILIGWQIWNYVYFEKKLDEKIESKLNEVENKLKKEYQEQITLSYYSSYLNIAKSNVDGSLYDPNVVLQNLSLSISQILKLERSDDLIETIIQLVNILLDRKCFESNFKVYAEAVDEFIPIFKLLLAKDVKIYELLKEIEKQRDNRGEIEED